MQRQWREIGGTELQIVETSEPDILRTRRESDVE